MQRKIATFFIGLMLLIGSPLAVMSFVDVYTHQPEAIGSGSAQTIEFKIIKNADCPLQQGDIRNLKQTSQKVRSERDVIDLFVNHIAGSADHNPAIIGNFSKRSGYLYSSASLTTVPIFLRNRTLII